MAKDTAARMVSQRHKNIAELLGVGGQSAAASARISDMALEGPEISEILADQMNRARFAQARELTGAREEDIKGTRSGRPISEALSPLAAAAERTRASKEAASGAGIDIPGGGILAALGNAVSSTKDVGLKTAGFLGQQYSRLAGTIPAAVTGSLSHMAEGELPWETLDDAAWAAKQNAWHPGSVPNTGGDVVNSYTDLSDRLIESKNPFAAAAPPISLVGKLLEEKGIVSPAEDIKLGSPSTWTNLLNPTRAAEVGTGLAIDIFADPLSWGSLGATSVLKSGSKEAIEATTRAALEEAATKSHLPQAAQNALRKTGTKKGTEGITREIETVATGSRRGVKKLNRKIVEQRVAEQAEYVHNQIVQEGRDWINKNITKYKGKTPRQGVYRQLYDQARQAADNEIANLNVTPGMVIDAKGILKKHVDEVLNEHAVQYADEIKGSVQRIYDPLLRRRVDARVGLLGRGKSIAESSLANKAATSQGRVAQGLRKYLGDNPVSNLMETAYKPIGAAGNYNRSTRLGQMALNSFSSGDMFPGQINKIRQATKAAGIRAYDLARKGNGKMPVILKDTFDPLTGKVNGVVKTTLESWNTLFKDFDEDLAKEMYDAMESGRVMTGTTRSGRALKEVQEKVQEWLQYVKEQRLDLGLMDEAEIAEDFLPIKIGRVRKGELEKQVQKIKEARRAEVNNIGRINSGTASNLAADPANAGLKFDTDIRTVLGDYYAKHQRDMVRHRWRSEMLNGYSIPAAQMDDSIRSALNLKEVSTKHIPKNMQGAKYYMTRDMADVMDNFEKLWSRSTSSLDEVKSLTNAVESANRAWKIGATVARPAFQLRNAIGDVATGWLDQVPSWKYTKYAKARLEGPSGVLFEVGGKKYTVQAMDDRFLEHAGASTYYNPGSLSDKLGNKVANKVMDFNEARESLPRKVHYTDAFEGEMRQQVKAHHAKFGGRDPVGKVLKDMEEKAQSAAVSRVNKYKFDYSDLTPFESQWMRNLFPFYTFQKKATEMVLENALLNPGRISALNKTVGAMQAALSGDTNEEWMNRYDSTIPDWAKEMGFVPTQPIDTDGDVWGFNTSVLPQSTVSQLFSGDTNQNIVQNFAGQLNPFLRLPFEQATGEDIGTGIPREASAKGLMEYVPPIDTLSKILNVAGAEGAAKFLGEKTAGEKPTALSAATLLGIPVQKVTEEQRVYAEKATADPYERIVGKVNKDLEEKNLEVRTITRSDKKGKPVKVFRVQTSEVDPETGERSVYKEFQSRSDAYAYAVAKAKD